MSLMPCVFCNKMTEHQDWQSAGHVSQEQVKRYIQEQMGKDVFEYDIYGCPDNLKGQLKIGDFIEKD